MDQYGITRTVDLPYESAIAKITEELKKVGFGILTEIDVKETLNKKLGKNFRPYRILGACNPNFAYQALSEEINIGLLMPCNVIVYEEDQGKTVISIVNPKITLGRVGNQTLEPLAEEALSSLTRAIDSV